MIIVKFQGRLGNQLFQYAFALTVAIKFKTFFLLDSAENSQFVKYFECKYYTKFNLKLLKIFGKYKKERIVQNGAEPFDILEKKIKNNSYFQGFFQSVKYFETIKIDINQKIIIKKEYRKLFEESYGKLFKEKKILAIHCRFGDYAEYGDDELGGKNLVLPQKYYSNAINSIENIESYQIIIVTDDIKSIENRFDFLKNKRVVSESEIIDFQILQNAHKLIISNSTFSWWAAYLNNKMAIVYAPEYWLGFKVKKEYPVGILANDFIKISVD
jgi:hypothetical protein